MKNAAIFLILVCGYSMNVGCRSTTTPEFIVKNFQKIKVKYDQKQGAGVIIISVPNQTLYLLKGEEIYKSWPVSTSSYGVGSQAGSNKTPPGIHTVKYKYGADAPIGTIFRARKSTGDTAIIYTDTTDSEDDLVTTRILWLSGLEEGINLGKNIDSYKRFIYIHGTNEEGLIGTPASHGCIRMKNRDVIELFDRAPIGTLVAVIESH